VGEGVRLVRGALLLLLFLGGVVGRVVVGKVYRGLEIGAARIAWGARSRGKNSCRRIN